MSTRSQDIAAMKKKVIPPFEVTQAMVALELSKTDEPVLAYFDFFARQIPVPAAYFLHVLPKFDLFDTVLDQDSPMTVGDYELNQEVIERMENKIKERLSKKNSIYVEFDVKEGDPLEELLKDAEDVGADLLVIGQKTETDYHGIMARNLVRRTPGNALVVPDQAQPTLRRMLIPIDFSDNSVRALQTAVAINKRLEEPAELICLNVYELPNLSVYKASKTPEQFKKMMEADRENAFRAFIDTYAPEVKDSVRTELVSRDLPGIGRYIYDFAEEEEVDFIVMGAKGHSKVELLFIGSVTEKVLALNDKMPVLIVK